MTDTFLVDSHCHLDFADFEPERDEIVKRARQEGVGLLLTISTRIDRFADLNNLIDRYPNVYASIGTHPLHVAEEHEASVDDIVRISRLSKVVAIGEAGLDYHYDRAPHELQERVFRRHIEAARTTGLPLIVHARDADTDIQRILEDETGKGAFPFVLHCFTAGAQLAEAGVDLGGYVSFSGIAAFKSSEALRDIARNLPKDRILVETDAPYLAPPPHRGKRNEPAFVKHTATTLASALDMEFSKFAKLTSDNFFRLFSKVPDPRQEATA